MNKGIIFLFVFMFIKNIDCSTELLAFKWAEKNPSELTVEENGNLVEYLQSQMINVQCAFRACQGEDIGKVKEIYDSARNKCAKIYKEKTELRSLIEFIMMHAVGTGYYVIELYIKVLVSIRWSYTIRD